MKLCFEGERFSLAGGQTVGLRDQQGAQVEVLRGEIWVTQEGDRRDLIFGDGDTFRVERPGTTVLHALGPVQIRVQERPRQRAPWGRGLGRRLLRSFGETGESRARNTAYRL